MRALTLYRPWGASMLFGPDGGPGPKPIENRTWPPSARMLGQVIALHHGQRYDDEGAAFLAARGWNPDRYPQSRWTGIIGTARIVGFVDKRPGFATQIVCPASTTAHRSVGIAKTVEASPFFFGPVGWLLEERVGFPRPVECLGHQQLWTVPEDLEEEIERVRREIGR